VVEFALEVGLESDWMYDEEFKRSVMSCATAIGRSGMVSPDHVDITGLSHLAWVSRAGLADVLFYWQESEEHAQALLAASIVPDNVGNTPFISACQQSHCHASGLLTEVLAQNPQDPRPAIPMKHEVTPTFAEFWSVYRQNSGNAWCSSNREFHCNTYRQLYARKA
jgi:hypothetical protein